MNFFTAFLLTLFAIWLVFRVFGRQIIRFILNRVLRSLVQNAQQEAQQYQENYQQNPFNENVYRDNELEISTPKNQEKKGVNLSEIVEDIEFEDNK